MAGDNSNGWQPLSSQEPPLSSQLDTNQALMSIALAEAAAQRDAPHNTPGLALARNILCELASRRPR